MDITVLRCFSMYSNEIYLKSKSNVRFSVVSDGNSVEFILPDGTPSEMKKAYDARAKKEVEMMRQRSEEPLTSMDMVHAAISRMAVVAEYLEDYETLQEAIDEEQKAVDLALDMRNRAKDIASKEKRDLDVALKYAEQIVKDAEMDK